MARYRSKLVYFLMLVANTLAWTNTLAYHRICKLQIRSVFIVQGPMFVISQNVCSWQAFTSLVKCFVGKAGAYPIEEPFRCSTLRQAPGLAHKQQTGLERLARDKPFSLLRKFVIYSRKKFYKIGPRYQEKICYFDSQNNNRIYFVKSQQ